MTELKAAAIDERFDLRVAANRMCAAADALLSNLTREQLNRAMFPFENEAERRDWDFIPKYRPNGYRCVKWTRDCRFWRSNCLPPA